MKIENISVFLFLFFFCGGGTMKLYIDNSKLDLHQAYLSSKDQNYLSIAFPIFKISVL